jgi:hypothetical protein
MVVEVHFATYQTCRSNEGWQPVTIDSKTDPDKKYVVLVNPWGDSREHICDCEGYHYRGFCSHQERADAEVCRWKDTGLREAQTPVQQAGLVCPRCGGPTKVELSI